MNPEYPSPLLQVESANLVDTIRYWAERQPDAIALTYLADGDNIRLELSYSRLLEQVNTVADALMRRTTPGQRALLCLSNEIEYIVALLACFETGVIAVPSLVPNNSRAAARIECHLTDSGANLVLVDSPSSNYLQSKACCGLLKQVARLDMDDLDKPADNAPVSNRIRHEIAYLQYTSGSTMAPRGVMISHANLRAQRENMVRQYHQKPGATIVNWMPLYHDFGLVFSLQAFETGGRCVILPASRVTQPVRWLSAIARFGASISAGPTFMYDLCARKIKLEQLSGLHLGNWKVACIGAEPIQAEVLEAFITKFSSVGFQAESMSPGYGMAEATLAITSKDSGKPVVIGFDEAALHQGLAVENSSGRLLVSSGRPCWPDCVKVVDRQTKRVCPDGVIGELWASTPSVGMGYWGRESTGESPFAGFLADDESRRFLRTGDLAFVHEGQVFITGRSKDVIIINGENRYPQDLEWTINHCHPAIEVGAGVAIGMIVDGLEHVAVIHEITRSARNDLDTASVVSAIRTALGSSHGIDVHAIFLLGPASLPKTSSGKVQRQATKQLLLSDQLPTLHVWRKAEIIEAQSDFGDSILARCRVLLGNPTLGVDDNLFSLGLDSLKAMELITDLETAFQRVIDPAVFADAPTVRGLIHLLDKEKSTALSKEGN